MSDYLAAKGGITFRFKNFQINVDIESRSDDPIRSWTEENGRFSKDIFNGLCIRQPHQFLSTTKPNYFDIKLSPVPQSPKKMEDTSDFQTKLRFSLEKLKSKKE